ncbi:hypothetical protein ACUOA8_37745 [Escherichia sp. SS-MK2]
MDIQLRKIRDHQAAYMFMKTFEAPTVLTTDKASAHLCALYDPSFGDHLKLMRF